MRRLSKPLAAAAALFLSTPAGVAAPDAKPLQADIRKLLALSGAGQLGVQTMRQLLPVLRSVVPQAPESFWAEFESRINPDEIVDLIVPIYAKHFSAEDVKNLIAFYESPTGRKLASVQPVIAQESMVAGQQWGRSIAKEIVRQARARGFQVKDI